MKGDTGAPGAAGSDGAPGRAGVPGHAGDDALYLIRVFKNSTSAISAAPTGGSYVTNTKTISVLPTGWTAAPTTTTGTEKVYVSEASIDPNLGTTGNSFTITPTWQLPSEQGGDGPAGAKGDKGDTGVQGVQGVQGKEGKMGKLGLQGPMGKDGRPGTTGPNGPNGAQGVYYIRVYKNSATAITTAPTTGTYVISTKTLTGPTGWTTTPSTPVSGSSTYVTEATIDPSTVKPSILDPSRLTDSITPSWNTPYEAGSSGPAGAKGDKGDAGVAGAKGNTGNIGNIGPRGRAGAQGLYYVRIYQNSASAPSTPTGGSYNIATYTITPPTGWSATFTAPTGTDKTYIAEARVNPQTPTNVFTPSWNTPYASGGTGPAGAKGDTGSQGVFYIRVFKNSATAITTAPTDGTYVISTKVLTVPTGWDLTPSTPVSGEKTYVTEATIDPATADNSSTPSWNTPYEAGSTGPAGAKGDKGSDGAAGAGGDAGAKGKDGDQGIYTVRIFTKKASPPSTPTGGTYDVANKSLSNVPNNWAATPPTSLTSTQRIYAAEVTIDPATDSGDVTITWGAPYQYVGRDGTPGARGVPGKGAKGDTGATGEKGTQWFMQANAPTTANVTINTGDIWINTSTGDDCGKASVHSGTSWVAQTSWAMDITCS